MNRSDDTIRRQSAIDAVEKESQVDGAYGYMDTKSIVDLIMDLPSAQRWIPVSERLPKPYEEVFVYLWGNVPHLASVNSEGQWETDQFYLDADDTPKAWMPLPECYRGEKDGE